MISEQRESIQLKSGIDFRAAPRKPKLEFGYKAIIATTVVILSLFAASQAKADVSIFDGNWYAELGAGYSDSWFQTNPEFDWESGGSPGFYGSIRYELMLDRDRLGVVLHYTHHSNWFTGPPFNNDAESSLDHVGVAVRWKLNQ